MLFEVPETKSPRKKWIEKHGLRTMHVLEVVNGEEDAETGDTLHPWLAWKFEEGKINPPRYAPGGGTEDDALAEWARQNGRRMWFEDCL